MLKTSQSLAFRSLLKTASHRASVDRPDPQLTGLTPPAMALHAAVVSATTPLLVVVPTDADVEQVTADARFFFATVEGLSDDAVRQAVRALPSQEVDPYRGLAPHLEVASVRAGTLHALALTTAAPKG